MPSYTIISRPAVPTYTGIPKTGIFDIFTFQDGVVYEFQDENYKIFYDNTDSMYTTVTRPSVPTYNEITRPS